MLSSILRYPIPVDSRRNKMRHKSIDKRLFMLSFYVYRFECIRIANKLIGTVVKNSPP